MTTRTFLTLTVALILGTLIGCGSSEQRPPTIHYGEDISEMGMIISDPRYAAALVPQQGSPILFDDIGELFKYRQSHAPPATATPYVNDFNQKRWLRAEQAWYLRSGAILSPMGWGIAAFGDETTVRQAQVDRGGEILTWHDIQSRDWSKPAGPGR